MSVLAPHCHPPSFAASEAYLDWFEREMQGSGGEATVGATMNSLNPDNEKMKLIIAARQKKRVQMAVDKSHCVTEAMGTLALGGGKG